MFIVLIKYYFNVLLNHNIPKNTPLKFLKLNNTIKDVALVV